MINSITFWFILGILLLLSEFLIPGFTIFFFGLGAILTSILLVIISPLDNFLWVQVIFFLGTSITLFITLRRKFKKTLKGELFKEKDDYTGKECLVIESVTKEKQGRIKFNGTTWSAISLDKTVKKNQKATILGKKDGNPLVFIIQK
ncbi:NfeD family protein [Thiospirochaeta perfilievii]|uniref:NfeD family protein n=1 Tax=Thiospirochaeta perfilievii TaxID=252967 RepID=A0A5C1Q9J4_9SPIO|nr:NfeD family protein [Thiospirochaeta perfilievii]QEN04803.1 NfeD family protein [Thiospirochaeta perfilievii]